MSLFRSLNRLMHEHGFYPNRKLSQNFVVSDELLEKIVAAASLEKSDVVLEVGAGTGFLTRKLLEHSRVISVEIDARLCSVLRSVFSKELSEGRLVLLEGDFFKIDLPKFSKVACLPPYHVSSGLLFSLVSFQKTKSMVFVLQKDFVQKCVSKEGFPDYGPLSVLLGHYFEAKVLEWNISPESFFPKPHSFSSLVVFNKKKGAKKIRDFDKFGFFLKTIFRFRNKKLSNALENSFPFLKTQFGFSKKSFDAIVSSLGQKNKKVYFISPNEFVNIFDKLV